MVKLSCGSPVLCMCALKSPYATLVCAGLADKRVVAVHAETHCILNFFDAHNNSVKCLAQVRFASLSHAARSGTGFTYFMRAGGRVRHLVRLAGLLHCHLDQRDLALSPDAGLTALAACDSTTSESAATHRRVQPACASIAQLRACSELSICLISCLSCLTSPAECLERPAVLPSTRTGRHSHTRIHSAPSAARLHESHGPSVHSAARTCADQPHTRIWYLPRPRCHLTARSSQRGSEADDVSGARVLRIAAPTGRHRFFAWGDDRRSQDHPCAYHPLPALGSSSLPFAYLIIHNKPRSPNRQYFMEQV